jgi:hypothetical protein
MPNYQRGKIYRIISPSKNLVYYGSTIQSLGKRIADHLCNLNRYSNNISKTYYLSFLVLECEDYKIELVENYPCNNKQELCKKEGEYIKANECVNKNVAGRTMKEWRQDKADKIKQYNIANADKKKEYGKQWRTKNANKIKEYYINNVDKFKEYYLKKKLDSISQE